MSTIDQLQQQSNYRPIKPLVSSMFSDNIGDNFVAFVAAYYEWHDLLSPRQIIANRDIDRAEDRFVEYFRKTYSPKIQLDSISDQRTLVKHILDIYRSRGSARAIKLLLQLLFNTESEVTYPSDKILKPSGNIWVEPKYIELIGNFNNIKLLNQTTITGKQSGATAFVNFVDEHRSKLGVVAVADITNIVGVFNIGEQLVNTNCFIKGSLRSIIITTKGLNIQKYSEVTIESGSGQEATGRIVSVDSVGGIKVMAVLNSGIGFVNNQPVTIKLQNIPIAQGTAVLTNIGQLPGRYLNNVGMLSQDNFLHDGEYYQQFSYVISSSVSKVVYDNILKDLLHVAGTKSFSQTAVSGRRLNIPHIDQYSEISKITDTNIVASSLNILNFNAGSNIWIGII